MRREREEREREERGEESGEERGGGGVNYYLAIHYCARFSLLNLVLMPHGTHRLTHHDQAI